MGRHLHREPLPGDRDDVDFPVAHFARQHRDALRDLPTAFFSVSLTAAFPGAAHLEEAASYVVTFIRETGWRPGRVHHVAGALLYTRYDFMKRTLARLIAREAGAVTDTSRDVEYTDWTQLEHDVIAFLASLPARYAVAGDAETRRRGGGKGRRRSSTHLPSSSSVSFFSPHPPRPPRLRVRPHP